MDTRFNLLRKWLEDTLNNRELLIETASADASFRRYFRVTIGAKSLIAMDAPPLQEDCRPFVRLARLLRELKVHTPEVHAEDLDQGFILLEDLGNQDYLDNLGDTSKADTLYGQAIEALLKLQQGDITQVEPYTEEKLKQEMSLFKDWYLEKHLDQPMSENAATAWNDLQNILCEACAEQPSVWVHRDFHSRNLMVTKENNPGVIDFQDLVAGPISYDLASIFKDCYIEWPRSTQLKWLNEYYQKLETPNFSFETLVQWYDLTGFQRHLKVLGIFCRLNYRDGKADYLSDLPLVAKYCLEVMDIYSNKIKEVAEFSKYFSEQINQSTPS